MRETPSSTRLASKVKLVSSDLVPSPPVAQVTVHKEKRRGDQQYSTRLALVSTEASTTKGIYFTILTEQIGSATDT